jgi:tetratricopeptide (TPR) repeat protein
VRSIPAVLSLLGLLALCGCSTSSAIEQSRAFERRGFYQQGFEVLDHEYKRQLEGGGVAQALEEEHARMKLESIRHRAQSLIFREREDEALELLAQLEAVSPGFHGAQELVDHAHHKQAKRLVLRGDRLLSERDFQQAMQLYIESQRIVPEFEPASAGMLRVKDELARMDIIAQSQFIQAVRKYPEFRHIEVAWHAAAVLKNTPDPDDERRSNAARLSEDARVERARAKQAEAAACERANKFGAALVLYRQAKKLGPELEDVQEAIERMESELDALGLIESAQLTMRTGDFEQSREILDQAFERSVLSRGAISELMIQNRKLEGEAAYRAARDFEVMGKKAEALAAFEALADKWPDGLEDEAARIDALRVDIEGAEDEWRAAVEAEGAGELEKAIDHYGNAERFYERWRDGEAQIERLKKELAARAAEGAGGVQS